MKSPLLFSLVLALALPAGLCAQSEVAFRVPTAGAAAGKQFTEAELLETFGWFVGRRVGLGELELSAAELDTLIKGLRRAAARQEAPHDLEQMGPQMEAFLQRKQEVFVEKLRQQTLRESIAFLARAKARPGVISRPSGLAYEVLTEGQGEKPAATATVRISYVGTLIDGTVFDESEGVEEVKMEDLLPGMAEALQQVKVGSKIRVYLPPHLAFGDEGLGPIPPSATVIFEIDFREIALDWPPPRR
jgi:FKBP-type peptidyl-prolyl cis-trans isomerase